MADVIPEMERNRGRGQLFIVTALALATVLITLGLLLNTAIYIDVLAARDPGPGTGEVVKFETSVDRMASETMHVVNRQNNTTYTELRNTYDDVVNNWSLGTSRHMASLAADGHAEVVGTTFGTRFEQDSVQNFSNRTGTTQWTLAKNVTVRDYSMTVERSSLPIISVLSLTDTFALTFTNEAGDLWKVHVYGNSTDADTDPEYVIVKVVEPDGSTSKCAERAATVTIDVTGSTVAGERCSALSFLNMDSQSYDVEYRDGNQVKGTYSLVVNKSVDYLHLDDFYRDTEAGNPYYTPALYSSTLRVTYRNPSAFYRTVIRVAPGEPDA